MQVNQPTPNGLGAVLFMCSLNATRWIEGWMDGWQSFPEQGRESLGFVRKPNELWKSDRDAMITI